MKSTPSLPLPVMAEVLLVHAIKTRGGVEIWLHSLWTLGLDGAHWLPPHHIQIIRAKRDNGNHWTRNWVTLQTLHECSGQEEKIPSPNGNQTPGHPSSHYNNWANLLFEPVWLHAYWNGNNLHYIFDASASTKGNGELQNERHMYLNKGRSHGMSGLCSWKNAAQLNRKFRFTALYFLRVRGLTTLSRIVKWLYQ